MSPDLRALANRGLHAWRTGGLHLFRDFAALASGQMIGRVLNFVAFAFLARVLDPVGYGAVEYVVGLSVFFAMVVDAGLGPIGVRRVMRHPDELDTLAFQIPFARLLIAVAGVPAMALFAIAAMKGAAPAALVWLFALSLLTAPWRQEWLLQASGRMTEAAIAQVVRAVVFAIAVWTLVRAPRDLMFVGWAEIASVTTMTAYTLWIQHIRIARLRVHRSFTGLGRLLREGWGLGLTNLVWAMIQYAPLFLAGAILSGAPIAWFGAALRLMSSLITFSNLYHFNLYPAVAKAAAEGPEALRRLMRRSFRVVAWGGIAAALALTLFAAPATRIIFGPKLVQAAPLLQVLAWTLPITLLSSHSRWGLVAVSAQTRALWSHVAGLVVLVIVSLLLGLQWGARQG